MRLAAAALAATALIAAEACAAELPNMKAAPPPMRARPCNFGGMNGLLTASGVCVKISGYMTGGVQAGSLKGAVVPPPAAARP